MIDGAVLARAFLVTPKDDPNAIGIAVNKAGWFWKGI
jgi:hypothetical protein